MAESSRSVGLGTWLASIEYLSPELSVVAGIDPGGRRRPAYYSGDETVYEARAMRCEAYRSERCEANRSDARESSGTRSAYDGLVMNARANTMTTSCHQR